MTTKTSPYAIGAWRFYFVAAVLLLGFCGLISRVVYLQVYKNDFLQKQSDVRSLGAAEIAGYRGAIKDRNGRELAVSLAVPSVAIDAKLIYDTDQKDGLRKSKAWKQLAALLGLKTTALNKVVDQNKSKRFVWVKRRLMPEVANLIRRLDLPGVHLETEYRRYYPTGAISAHVVGFTNVDDKGIEGIERAFDDVLTGKPGKEQVLRDRKGRVVENKGVVEAAIAGQDIVLSIDSRLQAIAYDELASAVKKHQAIAGSAVIVDVHTGEVLAMVNQPSYDPNNRKKLRVAATRNRAVTDMFEPGSTVKPITVVSALESGKFSPSTIIDTNPGYIRVGGAIVRDSPGNNGVLDVTGVLQKSSNIGVTKMAMAIGKDHLFDTFKRFGFGESLNTGFPGESAGRFNTQKRWSQFEVATVSFGYAMTTTPLQLAHAYSVLANGGIDRPITLQKQMAEVPGVSVVDERIANRVLRMMEEVTADIGTGKKARVEGYRVSGKTGTARKAIAGGYSSDQHLSFFAGIAPIKNPRLAMVVLIDEPHSKLQSGGEVAAPVFSNVMNQALRLINVAPDDDKAIKVAEVTGGQDGV